MRGRAVEAIVYPFSFAEHLLHRGIDLPDDPSFLTARQRSLLERAFREYLSAGGFPEAQGVSARDRRHLLQGYVDIVLLRDIAERHHLTNLPAIRWLVRQLLANAGGPFSASRFHKALHSQKIRSSVNGLLIELLRRGADVTWVRTPSGYEVDFLARFPGGDTELIQVAALLDHPATVEREFRALADAHPVFQDARLRLFTLNRESGTAVPGELEVEVTPAYEWLLSGES